MSDTFPQSAQNPDAIDGLVDPDQEKSSEGTVSYDDAPDDRGEQAEAQQHYGEVTAEDLSTDDQVADGGDLLDADSPAGVDTALASVDPDTAEAQPDGDRLVSEQAGEGSDTEHGGMSDPAMDHVADADER